MIIILQYSEYLIISLTNNDIKTILNNIGAQTFRKRMNGNISIIQKGRILFLPEVLFRFW